MLLISTQHLQESQNKYDWRTNNKILTRRLCVCSACCSVLFFANATTTKIINYKYFSKVMNLNQYAYESNIFRII